MWPADQNEPTLDNQLRFWDGIHGVVLNIFYHPGSRASSVVENGAVGRMFAEFHGIGSETECCVAWSVDRV